MRIASGVTDQYIYFVARDTAGGRLTGLSSFTVYRSRNGGAAAAFTTPTVNETDASNMPGVYELLLDEDMTIDAGDETQEVALHITQASMVATTRTFELYRPKITAGETLTVASGRGNADVTHIATAAVSTTTAQIGVNAVQAGGTAWASGAITANSIASNALTSAKIAANAIGASQIASGAFTAAKFAAGAFDAVWSVTARLLTAGTNIVLAKGTGVTGFNDLSAAQVNAEVDTALADYDAPTNTEMTAAFTEIKGATWATTDTLEAIRDRGDAAWTTATGFSTHSAADVRAEIDSNSTQLAAILTDTAEIGAAGAGLTALATASALTTVDSNVDAIKAKTDSLTYTVAGQVDANIQYVNDVQVSGTGASGDEWGP